MIFWNERKGETLVVEDAHYKSYEAIGGERKVLMRPILITFEAFGNGLERPVAKGIPFKHSTARSHCETNAVSEKIKMLGLGFWDEDGNDVTEKAIESFLCHHKRRDRSFIRVDDQGNWLPREDIVAGSGTYFCSICAQTLVSELALLQHRISPPHLKREIEVQEQQLLDEENEKAPPPRKAKAKKAVVEATA